MTTTTNAQLAAHLREDADFLEDRGGVPKFTIERIRLAAQRLEAREVSEAMRAAAITAGCIRIQCEWPTCGCAGWPQIVDTVLRAALEAAKEE